MKKKTTGEIWTVILPQPKFKKNSDIIKALKNRKTTRQISSKKLSPQMLSNLLWAACGVNRKKGPFGIPGITAASASNSQEILVYVAVKEGIYCYEPRSHSLIPVVAGDLRVMALGRGQGKMGSNAPVRLVYVVDKDKFKSAVFQEPGLYDAEVQKAYYYIDAGMIAQNVYLFCASQGLASWFHNCDKHGLATKLGLKPHQLALFGHTVGYAGK